LDVDHHSVQFLLFKQHSYTLWHWYHVNVVIYTAHWVTLISCDFCYLHSALSHIEIMWMLLFTQRTESHWYHRNAVIYTAHWVTLISCECCYLHSTLSHIDIMWMLLFTQRTESHWYHVYVVIYTALSHIDGVLLFAQHWLRFAPSAFMSFQLVNISIKKASLHKCKYTITSCFSRVAYTSESSL